MQFLTPSFLFTMPNQVSRHPHRPVTVFALLLAATSMLVAVRDAAPQVPLQTLGGGAGLRGADVVNLFGSAVSSARTSVFTVPGDRWFVATDVRYFVNATNSQLVEHWNGSDSVKRTQGLSLATLVLTTGFAFRPGATVDLVSPSGPTNMSWEINGYLTR